MINFNRILITFVTLVAAWVLPGCGGGGGGGGGGGSGATPDAATAATFSVGGAVSGLFGSGLVLQNNAGDDLTVSADGSFSFTTKLAAGAAYAVAIKSQPKLPTQTCTLAAASGAMSATNVTSIAVSCALALSPPKFAYVANAADPSITVYSINPTTGVMTAIPPVGSEYQFGGTTPVALAVDPSNKFMYVTDSVTAGTVRAFTLNPTTGKYTAVAGGTYSTGGQLPGFVAVDPTGKFVYASNSGSASVAAFAINPATGALTAVPGSPFAAGNVPKEVTVDPKGKFVYVTNSGSVANTATLSSYTINASTGALTPLAGSPLAATSFASSLMVDPTGRVLTVTGSGTGFTSALQSYAINPVSGALTILAPNGPGFATGASLTYDPSGRSAYVANFAANTILGMNFNTTGLLASVSSTPAATGTGPTQVVADPSGKFVYVANSGPGGAPTIGSISGYSIDPLTGNLTALPGGPISGGLVTRAIALTR